MKNNSPFEIQGKAVFGAHMTNSIATAAQHRKPSATANAFMLRRPAICSHSVVSIAIVYLSS